MVLQTVNCESPFAPFHLYNDLTHEQGFGPNLLGRLMRRAGLDSMVARETGPVPLGYSLTSSVRSALWQGIRAGIMTWNLVETGTKGSGVYTRIFMMSGVMPGK